MNRNAFRTLIVILLLSWCHHLFAQQSGMINDPDGYTNLREGPGVNFKILTKVFEDERFQYYPDEENSWWKVIVAPTSELPITGYMHKSRVQPFSRNKDVCKCNLMGTTLDDQPELIAKIGNSKVVVCGYVERELGQNHLRMSEFSITDCSTSNMMRFFGARETCNVKYNGELLQIDRMIWLPVRKGLEWVETRYKETLVINSNGSPKLQVDRFVVDITNISDEDIAQFEEKLPQYEGIGYFEEIEDFVGKLLICSMKGSQKCSAVFTDISTYLDFVLDGAVALFYNDCKQILAESQ